ncbi:hypothetical protein MVEN_02101000 [Mycena venus]|uniref:P-loop containing nucleoside triphosphate hydrolase protein n=1 Tax=Mycena venus TaxID=2733690 RepID=A0A8H6X8Y5_9AGAR|nr:hypothetical protein MVEN_02101000 [Mycena venus]
MFEDRPNVSPPLADQSVATRGYQQEMLDESLQKNIIIAMETGSGKTHIAVLRMKLEAEREPSKISWFMAPTRALCDQQKAVIQAAIGVPVGLISGNNHPDQWTDTTLWQSILKTYRIMVSTPQVLLDALHHAHINMGNDIGLLIFDEAHHAVDKHPYNEIMKNFYFDCPPRVIDPDGFRSHKGENVRPMHVLYRADPSPFSTNLATFEFIFQSLDIENDPYVIGLRHKLAKTSPHTADYTRLDQRLSNTILHQKSFTHSGLQDVANTARAICSDIGPWAADWYICQAIEQAKTSISASDNIVSDTPRNEKAYLKGILDKIVVTPVSYCFEDIVDESSDKVHVLVERLLAEKSETETHDESYSGLIFVERRESVLALAEVLSHHPETKDIFNVGCLIGASGSGFKHSVLDITRSFVKSQSDTLQDFQAGKKNLIVSTAVAEEGIDLQACGSVIRWDPPPNMPSWAQSRGRARRKRSTFTLMFEETGAQQKTVKDWEQLERDMVALYNDPSRNVKYAEEEEGVCDDNELEFRVEATGAVLTLHSAVSHLNHFCAIIPNSGHVDHKPLYDIDPPELPEGWHSNRTTKIEPYSGPYGAKVTLPRLLPSHLRVFETERVHSTKASAYRHAAFYAYRALYENGLLNDNLLPLKSVVEPELETEVKALLEQVEKRAGTARVSMQMDPWGPDQLPSVWYTSELVVTGLPPLLVFTRSKPTQWSGHDGPVLHRPGSQERVTLRPFPLDACSETIARAREYTRQLLWSFNGSRMSWNNLDFSYLFLPSNGSDGSRWDARRLWHTKKNPDGEPFFTNALVFGQDFSYPDDLAIIRNGPQFSKAYKFVRWRFDPLSPEEEVDMRAMYSRFPDLEMTYPVLVVQHFPPRTNFLIPVPEKASPPTPPKEIHLLPRLSYVTLCSEVETQYAFLLPSILRAMAMSMTVNSLRETLFSDMALSTVPEPLLMTAMCAPVSQEKTNYQRLETLGDTVLKFMSSIQLLAEYPLWHEGYLTQKMGHCVSNWIIRGKKWRPRYFTESGKEANDVQEDPDVEMDDVKRKKKGKSQNLSTKVLADVVESLIGAVYLHGGFDYALLCAQFFDLGIKWEPLPIRIKTILSRVETHSELPLHQLESVERMLGHTFTHKLLLVEALTHASYQQDLRTISYERLEFCGDAVLDMIVNEFLYRAEGKEYSPGHIFHRKSAMVNAHTLAFFCLGMHIDVPTLMARPALGSSPGVRRNARRIEIHTDMQTIHLWQCLLHSNPRIIDEQKAAFERFTLRRAEIDAAFASGEIFPWAALSRVQAPKFLSDMVESLLGAVFLDSQGDLDAVRHVLRKLGHLPVLERVVSADVDVLHPVSRLDMWAIKRGKKLSFGYAEEAKEISCAVLLDGEVVEDSRVADVYRGKLTKEEVRLAAAEKAIALFRLRDGDYATLKRKTANKSKKRKRSSSTGSVLRAAPSSPASASM